MRQITIRPVLNGWIVQVGCSEVVITSQFDMVNELIRYLNSPSAVEKEYLEKAINRDQLSTKGALIEPLSVIVS